MQKRMTAWLVAAVVLAALAGGAWAQTMEGAAGRLVAEAYGIDHWDQIEQIRYTFRVDRAERSLARSWAWSPKTGEVTRTVDGESLSFNADAVDQTSPEAVREAHHQFINDAYWFLMPFQLVWSDPELRYVRDAEMPREGGRAHKLVVSYPTGGYTPGDVYELYLEPEGKPWVRYWIFRRGGQEDGSLAPWSGRVRLGPIVVTTGRSSPEEKPSRPYFTDISATLVDGEEATPRPMP